MKKDIFIAGAWPYANYYMHIGHFAALLPGDVLAKYFRINGDNVIYVSGSDCHGTPITQRAKDENKTPYEIASHYHEKFQETFQNAGFEYDKYSNTMSNYHKEYVKKCFLDLKKNGYIYEKEILQDYCDKCNQFLSDREIIGTCPHCGEESSGEQCDSCTTSLNSEDVLNKHCKNCGTKTIMKNNKHLYFKLTSFKEDLQKLINDSKDKWRKNALGEAQKYLDMGLVDRAATRQLTWGVEVPVEGYEDKRLYVWIEAVLGYLSMGNAVAESRNINFEEFLSDKKKTLKTYYVHGKDNIPFHTIIFPALLKGMNRGYRLPDYIISCAYVNLNDEKMSKSKGNLITVSELLNKFERDTLRYYFIANGPELKDINCSIEDIIFAHNKFLVGVLGNFVNRNLSFINKKFDGIIKEAKIDSKIVDITKKTYEMVGAQIEKGEFRNAINSIFEYISLGNKYYDENEPWIKINVDVEEFNNITYTCVFMMVNISNLIYPIMMDASLSIKKMLGIISNPLWEVENIKGDIKINNLNLLYQRIE